MFTFSENQFGTYNAVVLGRSMVLENHPKKQICVIDSKSIAGAMVLLVQKAQRLLEAETEPDFQAVCEQLRVH